MPGRTIVLGLTAEITAELPADRDALGLLLAELRQATGDVAGHRLCRVLTPSSPTAVSLAELYASQDRWGDIVDLTNDLENNDELLTYLLIQRGVAFRELRMSMPRVNPSRGHWHHAPGPLPFVIWGLSSEASATCRGQRAMARKDFQKVLAEMLTIPAWLIILWRSASEARAFFVVALIASDTPIEAALEPVKLFEGIRGGCDIGSRFAVQPSAWISRAPAVAFGGSV
jgi:hypothetical protein